MRDVPQVVTRRTEDDGAHYAASAALDDVLEWFVNDGYTESDLTELAIQHVEEMFEP